ETEEWLRIMQERAQLLTENSAITAFERDLNRKAAQFEGTPEGEQLKELELHAKRVSSLLADLKEQRSKKPKTAEDMRRVVRDNEAKEAPAPLLDAVEKKLEFLPDEDKTRRDALEKDLKRRIAKDRASIAEKAFLDIVPPGYTLVTTELEWLRETNGAGTSVPAVVVRGAALTSWASTWWKAQGGECQKLASPGYTLQQLVPSLPTVAAQAVAHELNT
nr:hypothetical protein [Tanacetum cinerariifolium]